MIIAKAIFAAGCFWGVQANFDSIPGVISTEVGYTGGWVKNPSYEAVSYKDTGHAEAIEVSYDENIVSYKQLLDIFFSSHNPTTKNRQGPDIGKQYRSAIFYLNDQQKIEALQKISELNEAKVFLQPIVTEVVAAKDFYPAEAYHQKYLEKKGQKSCGSTNSFQKPLPTKEDAKLPSKEELKKKLTDEQYNVLIEKGTEKPFSGKYLKNKDKGMYACAVCSNQIFSSQNKYDSGSGWPSFDKAIPNSIKLKEDSSHGMNRTEVVCAKCGAHLGHMFDDGPKSTGERFCINSVSMDFEKSK